MALPLPQLTVQQLEYLVAVDNHASWADAASSLSVTPSALSQGLAELQRRLGVTLFDREGRHMVARPTADVVLAHAHRVLADTQDLARWAEQTRKGEAGQITVGMIDAAAVYYFSAALAQFRKSHGAVDLRLRVAPSAPLVAELRSGQLDVIVCVERKDDSLDGLETIPLLREPLFAYAPPGTPRTAVERWGPWVGFPANSHSRHGIDRALTKLGVSYEVVAESTQPEVLREMVRLGLGWAVLPEAEAELHSEPLVRVRKAPITARTLLLARRQNRIAEVAAESLTELLQASAAQHRQQSHSR